MKVLLWWTAAFGCSRFQACLCLCSGLQVNHDKWRGETVLQSTFTSKLLNMGNVSSCKSRPGRMRDQLTAAGLTGQVLIPSLCSSSAGSRRLSGFSVRISSATAPPAGVSGNSPSSRPEQPPIRPPAFAEGQHAGSRLAARHTHPARHRCFLLMH